MDEITSLDLRRGGSGILDRVMKGESLSVTRHGRTIGVLVPVEVYDDLTGVTVKDLAHTLGVRVPVVISALNGLIARDGRDAVVLRDLGGPGASGVKLYAEAAAQIYEALKPKQEPQ